MKALWPFLLLLTLGSLPTWAQTKPASRPTTPKPSGAGKAPAPARKPAPTPAPAPNSDPIPGLPRSETSPNLLFRKGSTLVNLGLGVGTGYGYDFADRADATPAISLAAERGVLEGIGPGVLSVGGLLGYKGYHYAYPNSDYKARWTTVVALVRGSYHYDLLENKQLDTYAGVSLGLRLETQRDTYYDAMPDKRPATSFGGVRFASGIYLGARYLLTSHLGAFAEAGYDMSYLKFGLTGQF